MPTRRQDYTVGWICALEIEYLVACELLDEEYGRSDIPKIDHSQDPNIYTFGRISEHNVVVACLPKGRYGLSSAAIVAERMRATFPALRFGLLVGIAGGAPNAKNDIRLGDVVVSVPTPGLGGVLQYDFGKAIQDHEFKTTGHLAPPPEVLLNALTNMSARHRRQGHQIIEMIAAMILKNPRLKDCNPPPASTDRLYASTYVHDSQQLCDCERQDDGNAFINQILVQRTGRPENVGFPCIHYGLIASSNQLIKDALTRDVLAAKHDVLCFEMEAAGLMNNFPCVAIRGICDYSDTHKNDTWHPFAAASAAAYTKELLEIIPGTVVATNTTSPQWTTTTIDFDAVDRLYYDSLGPTYPLQTTPPSSDSPASLFGLSRCLICDDRFSRVSDIHRHLNSRHSNLQPTARLLYLSSLESGLHSPGAKIFRQSMIQYLRTYRLLPKRMEVISMIERAALKVEASNFPELFQQPSLQDIWTQASRVRDDSDAEPSSRSGRISEYLEGRQPPALITQFPVQPQIAFTETSTEVFEYNERGNVVKRTISRRSSGSSMRSSSVEQSNANVVLSPTDSSLSDSGEQSNTALQRQLSPQPPQPRFSTESQSYTARIRAVTISRYFGHLRQYANNITPNETRSDYLRLVRKLDNEVQQLLQSNRRFSRGTGN